MLVVLNVFSLPGPPLVAVTRGTGQRPRAVFRANPGGKRSVATLKVGAGCPVRARPGRCIRHGKSLRVPDVEVTVS